MSIWSVFFRYYYITVLPVFSGGNIQLSTTPKNKITLLYCLFFFLTTGRRNHTAVLEDFVCSFFSNSKQDNEDNTTPPSPPAQHHTKRARHQSKYTHAFPLIICIVPKLCLHKGTTNMGFSHNEALDAKHIQNILLPYFLLEDDTVATPGPVPPAKPVTYTPHHTNNATQQQKNENENKGKTRTL